MKPVVYLDEANQELVDAVAASGQPSAFRQAVDATLADVASGFMTHAAFAGTPCRPAILHPYPYSLIYADIGSEILVIAVPHHRQRPGYWTRRLRP